MTLPMHHQLALRVLPDVSSTPARHAGWAPTVAAVAAWPAAEPTQPVVERRFWRTARRGRLHQAVVAGLRDPLGLCSQEDAAAELRELLRPLWSTRSMPAAPASLRRQIERPVAGYVAELGCLEGAIPEGAGALLPIFAQLLAGLEAIEGSVGLSLCVAPHAGVDADDAPVPRRAAFALRLFASRPISATLRARAEALCLTRAALDGEWQIAVGPAATAACDALREQRPLGPMAAAPSDVAALTLALPEPADPRARIALGRPVAGALPAEGAVLGRVPRPSGTQAPWRLSWAERRLHVLLAGASGCGKTTAMLRLALEDIAAGRTVVLVDPHGDVADQLAAVAPPKRLLHVDPRRPGTAPLDLLDPDPAASAAHLASAVAEVWPDDWAGPAWYRAVTLGLRALHESRALRRRPTPVDLERFFVDPGFRTKVIDGVADRVLAAELLREHETWKRPPREDTSMINWIASKLTPLTQGPSRPLFDAHVRASLETEVAGGAVIVVALPTGTLGSSSTGLIARMFLTRLTAAVAAQGNRPEGERQPVSVFIDEAHVAKGQALAGLFAQARKFNCSVTVACQSPSQLEPHLEDVLTNAQTHLYGRLSLKEAMKVGVRLGEAGVRALTRLPRHHLVLALEDNDPDLPPIVLTPVPPPRLPAPEPLAPAAPASPPVAEPDREPAQFDELLDELFPISGSGA